MLNNVRQISMDVYSQKYYGIKYKFTKMPSHAY